MKDFRQKIVIYLSSAGYILGCGLLFAMAVGIIFFASYSALFSGAMLEKDFKIYSILDEVGLIVFAIAVIDVAKYLIIEEVLKVQPERDPQELRITLVKFITIVVTALLLKGLVMAIEVSRTNIANLIYPSVLLTVPCFLLVGLGIFIKLTSNTINK